MVENKEPPTCAFESATAPVVVDQLEGSDASPVPGWLSPVLSERHIGIDQGTNNCAMVAVDKTVSSLPRIVGVGLYDLHRRGVSNDRIDTNAFVLALDEDTPIFD